jgi:uncharacterized membrane protein YhaH (DUF805 family)
MQALFSFYGRLARLPFFWCVVLVNVVLFVPVVIAMVENQASLPDDLIYAFAIVLMQGSQTANLVGAVLLIPVTWVSLAIAVKRLHDLGMTGAHVIWITAISIGSAAGFFTSPGTGVGLAISLVSFSILLWLLFAPGQPYENEYGPDPGGKDGI